MNAFKILLDELHSQHEQLDAAVKRDAAKPGFDFKPFIADEGPVRAVAGFRLSQETTTLASKLPNKLEPLYRAALNQLIAFEPRLTELIRVHEAFIEAAVNAANDEADCIDPAASKRHWDQIRECQRIAAVASPLVAPNEKPMPADAIDAADGPDDSNAVFHSNGTPYTLTKRQWQLAKELWGRGARPFAELGEAIWSNDCTPTGTIKPLVKQLNDRLLEIDPKISVSTHGETVILLVAN